VVVVAACAADMDIPAIASIVPASIATDRRIDILTP